MDKHQAVIEAKLDGIAQRLDRIEPKIDSIVPQVTCTEEKANTNRVLIKTILVFLLGLLGSGAFLTIRILAGS